jgi:ubiquinone biosynthesis protein COQ9
MGSEALAKQARRDIRRAFAPEASAEVLRFVETIRQEIALEHATQHNVNATLKEVDQTLIHRVTVMEKHGEQRQHIPLSLTFRQRLRWLLRGTWPA